LIQFWIVSDTAKSRHSKKWSSDPACEILFSASRRTVTLLGKLFKTTVQQGRSERKAEAYSEYVEALSEARTKLAVVFNSFLFVVLVFRV
jgi:phosphotransferase system IIA component